MRESASSEHLDVNAEAETRSVLGNPHDGYFSIETDGSIVDWGTNPFAEYAKPETLPVSAKTDTDDTNTSKQV